MDVRTFAIPDLKLVIPKRHGDARGFFVELWTDRRFREQVADVGFVQDNLSRSAEKGTIRGLHFPEAAPRPGQSSCNASAAPCSMSSVDIRVGSPTYRQHVAVRSMRRKGPSFGFLRAFCTGSARWNPDCEVATR